jgi:hypothetical protein
MTSKHGCPRRPGPPQPRWVTTKWVLRCCAAIWSPTARCTPSWLTIAASFMENSWILLPLACRPSLLGIPDRKAGHHGPTHPDRTGCVSPPRCRDARGGPPRGLRRQPRLGWPVPNRSRRMVRLARPPGPRHLRVPDAGPPATGVRSRGTESVEGGPGDFVRIPRGVVHREGNPGNEAIVFRVGEGEVLVNVDGP